MSAPNAFQSKPPRKRVQKKPLTLSLVKGSGEAIRYAAAILEVLAGTRTTTGAAEALGVSLPRYYALEARGVEGLVRACEPRKKGRQRSPSKELETLKREKARLEREHARSQALLRMAQRAAGFAPEPSKVEPKGKGKKGRRHRPRVRALVAIAALKSHNEPAVPLPGSTPATPGPK